MSHPEPWRHEPNRVEWHSSATGRPCLMVRGPRGAWCGYSAVAPSHAWFGQGYRTEGPDCVDVHGGLTYSAPGHGEIRHAQHAPRPDEPYRAWWWFGFDCSHCDDATPQHPERGGTYRDMAFVRAQVESLAEQLDRSDAPARMSPQSRFVVSVALFLVIALAVAFALEARP
jgi:hypothetical protein